MVGVEGASDGAGVGGGVEEQALAVGFLKQTSKKGAIYRGMCRAAPTYGSFSAYSEITSRATPLPGADVVN